MVLFSSTSCEKNVRGSTAVRFFGSEQCEAVLLRVKRDERSTGNRYRNGLCIYIVWNYYRTVQRQLRRRAWVIESARDWKIMLLIRHVDVCASQPWRRVLLVALCQLFLDCIISTRVEFRKLHDRYSNCHLNFQMYDCLMITQFL